jgi:O-methyltransferase
MDALRDRYLDLMAGVLTRSLWQDEELQEVRLVESDNRLYNLLKGRVLAALSSRELKLVRPIKPSIREDGRDWPSRAETMIGRKRMANLRYCVETCLTDGVPGDFIETGVWRGGAVIYMRAILLAHGATDRRVWAADSFRGLPPPDPERFPADALSQLHTAPQLAISVDDVRANVARYGLLDDQVCFLEGWFADTLPTAPIDALAVVRLDGDMYESTWDAITSLYPKLSPGGFIIVDDYGAVEGCRLAINNYRDKEDITDPIETIDWTGVFWRKGFS